MGRWVVMPTYNECENIPPLLREIFLVVPDVEVLVVDDKSPDDTADVVLLCSQPIRVCICMFATERGGLAALTSIHSRGLLPLKGLKP